MTLGPTTAPETMTGPQEPKKKEYRGRKRWLLLLMLLLLLMCTCVLWGYYLTTRQSITKVIPPAQQVIAKALRPHYLFSIYGLNEPVGVAVTQAGDRIYVAESTGDRLVKIFDRDGKPLATFAPPNSRSAGRAPLYIALDSAGQAYVSDRIRHSVDIYDAGGNYQRSLKNPLAESWSPLGLHFIGEYLILTDVSDKKHRVVRLSKDGGITFLFGHEGTSGAPDELWFPNSAVEDARGRVYVSDSNNGRIQVLDAAGNWLYTIPGFSLPRGLALDADQRLYIVDTVGQTVKVFDATKEQAEPLFNFGVEGVGDGEFSYPNDIALDTTDRLYIADRANNRVQVWVY
ncbi:MAG: hypothetical protein M1132_10930 [Chloroflexi bacterium]|nr:hypothetical protein [Chloroflexota bacterium]